MDSDYEIFEVLPDGSVRWEDSASSLIGVRRRLRQLGAATGNEYFGVSLPTREIFFPAGGSALGRRVFQVAYIEQVCKQRADLLRKYGCGVLSVMGNDAAKAVLTTLRLPADHTTFFLIGHAAPVPKRKEMVDWLRSRYPRTKILVLNPANEQIEGADYNVLRNAPELWLPILTTSTTATNT